MKHLSPFSQSRKQKYRSEIFEREIIDRHEDIYLPRHISAPSSQSRQEKSRWDTLRHTTPKVCQIDTEESKKTNLALDILKYQLKDSTSQVKHLENIRTNLERRLKVAKSQGNKRLVGILQDEYKQLSASF